MNCGGMQSDLICIPVDFVNAPTDRERVRCAGNDPTFFGLVTDNFLFFILADDKVVVCLVTALIKQNKVNVQVQVGILSL